MGGPEKYAAASVSPEAVIEATDLVKTYGSRRAVDGVSFQVARGEVLVVVGPNGAGKTTTVEILEGYRHPDGGTARVLGLDPSRDHRELCQRMGVMLQEGGIYPGIRALEALALFAAYYADAARPEELLEAVGLTEAARTPVRHLSGGQRQRLSLALALIGRPSVLFLDEPTAGMDPRGRAAAWEVVRTHRAEGVAVVLTTHAMDEAEALGDRVAVIDHGRLVAIGTPAELAAAAPVAETRFSAEPGLDLGNLAARLGMGRARVSETRPGEYVISASGTPELVAELTAWLRDRGVGLGDLRAGRQSLEDVYLRLTAETSAAEPEGGRNEGEGKR